MEKKNFFLVLFSKNNKTQIFLTITHVCAYFSAPRWRVWNVEEYACWVQPLFRWPAFLFTHSYHWELLQKYSASTVCYRRGSDWGGGLTWGYLVHKPGEPGWIPGAHREREGDRLHKVIFWPPYAFCGVHTHEHTHVLKGEEPRVCVSVCM